MDTPTSRSAAATRRRLHPTTTELLESRFLLSTYYVNGSSGADGNAGTSDGAAFRTLQKAADRATAAGDVVVVRAGTYNAGMNLYGKAGGAESAPITFAADPGAVITHAATAGTNASLAGINIEATGGWYVVRGFTIRSDGSMQRAGIRVSGSDHVQVLNNSVDEAFIGIFTSASDGLLIEGNTCTNSTDQHGIYVGAGCTGYAVRGNTLAGNNWDGLHLNSSLAAGENGNGVVENNVIHDNQLSGIDAEGLHDTVFRNNVIYGNGKHGITLHSQDQTDAGNPTDPCRDNTIVNNTIVSAGTFFGVQLRPEDTAGTAVFNNVLAAAPGSANANCGGVNLFNAAPAATFASDYNVVAAGNAFSTNGGNTRLSLAAWRAATGRDAHSLAADAAPIFVNPAADDYRLKAGSPAVDQGVAAFADTAAPDVDGEGNARPQGGGFDVGASELPDGGSTPDTTAPTIRTVGVSSLASSVAVVTWTTNELSDTLVEYGTTTDYGSTTTLDPSPVTRHSAPLADLAESTVYHYRVLSRDASGNLATSEDFVLTTPAPDHTPPLVSGVALLSLTTTGAAVRWTTDEPADSQVEYGITTNYGQSTPINPSAVTSHSAALSGLSPGTLYHYRVLSRDTSGNLTASSDFSFTTATPDTTPPKIASVAVAGVTASGATVTWITNEASDTQVEYGTSTLYGSLTSLNATPVTSHSRTLTGLSPLTTYHCRVRSKDSAGNVATSGDFTFTSLTLVYSAVPYYGDFANYTSLTASRWQVSADGGDTRLSINTSNYSEFDESRLGEMAVARAQSFGDFDVSLNARTGDVLAANPAADYDVVFGYVDATNYSYLMMNATTGMTTVNVVTAGVRRTFGGAAAAGIPDAGYHAVTLSRRGQTVTATLDGRTILSATDPALARAGAVGLGSFNDSAYFDNFTPAAPPDLDPTAALTGVVDKAVDGSAYHDVTVTYTDDIGIDPFTIDSSDVLVIAPDGSSQPAFLASPPTSSDPKTWTATYRIDAPGGAWDSADAGTYAVELVPQQVADRSGHFAGANVLGSFIVHDVSQVVGRQIGYWDGAMNFVAENKHALLPGGGTATFDNYSNDSAGITAVALDVSALSASAISTEAGFQFRVGDGTTWQPAPAPSAVISIRGGGANGSDRILISWPADTIKNTWLELTANAGAPTWLAREDVFYFGNLAGDTGDAGPGDAEAAVNIRDMMMLRRFVDPEVMAGGSDFDFNHDGAVDGTDMVVVRMNGSMVLPLFQPGAATATSTAAPAASADVGVANTAASRRSSTRLRRMSYELLSSES